MNFKVDNPFETEDSQQLQKAIDKISSQGGGQLIMLKGHYSLVEIWLKSTPKLHTNNGIGIHKDIHTVSLLHRVTLF